MRGWIFAFAAYMAVYVLIDQAVPGLPTEYVGSVTKNVLFVADWAAWVFAWAVRRI